MDIPIVVAFAFILLAAAADIVLSMKWHRAYFTVGIPVFIRRIARPGGISDLPIADLETSSRTAAGPPLVFRRLAPDVIMFREKVSEGLLHYIPIMHGVIRYDHSEGAVRVVGLLNWFVIGFVAGFAFLLGRQFFEMSPVVLAVFGIIYFIQAVRYNRVAGTLRRVGSQAT